MTKPLSLLILAPAILLAQSAGVNGRWFASADFYGTPINFPMEFSQQGDKLTGNFGGDKLEGTLTGCHGPGRRHLRDHRLCGR
jgi:hypothetical protein